MRGTFLYGRKSGVRISIGEHYGELRCLQLYIQVLNVVNRKLIFTWKLVCIGIGITSGYAAIAHFSLYPIFGVMFYVLFFEVAVIYAIMYEKAFQVSDLMAKARMALRMRGQQGLLSKAQRNDWARKLRSIPAVGIQVGEFHLMERTSTPVFLHYALTNIVNMLVTFQ